MLTHLSLLIHNLYNEKMFHDNPCYHIGYKYMQFHQLKINMKNRASEKNYNK